MATPGKYLTWLGEFSRQALDWTVQSFLSSRHLEPGHSIGRRVIADESLQFALGGGIQERLGRA